MDGINYIKLLIEVSCSNSQGEYIFILSAKNEERLKEYAGKMVHYLEGEESKKVALKDIVYTLQTGREEMEERLAVIAMSKEEIIKKLKFFLQKAEKGEIERVIRGSDKYNKKAKTEKELKSRDRSIMLQSLIESNDFTKIALLWTQGVDIDWDLLYQKETPCFKTSLPGYPFKKERHWFDSEKIIDESQNKEIQKLNIPGKKNKTPVPVIHQFYPDKKDLTFNIKDKIRNELASVLYRY